MAIGSQPETGVTFTTFGALTPEQHDDWYANIRKFGPDLLNGYATLAHPTGRQPTPPLAQPHPPTHDIAGELRDWADLIDQAQTRGIAVVLLSGNLHREAADEIDRLRHNSAQAWSTTNQLAEALRNNDTELTRQILDRLHND